jgi:Tat protein translocase TatB subunit
MFGLGFSEILIIAVLALLVFGPEKIPELMGQLGKWMRYFRGATNELKRTIETETRKILPPDVALPRFEDLVEGMTRSPRAAPDGASDGGEDGGGDGAPIHDAYGRPAKMSPAASSLPGDGGGAGPALPELDEELDAPPAVGSGSARRARAEAIARALEGRPVDGGPKGS